MYKMIFIFRFDIAFDHKSVTFHGHMKAVAGLAIL